MSRINTNWQAEVTASAGAGSQPVIVPRRIGSLSAAVFPVAGGACTVEYTLDDPQDVLDNPAGADWVAWEPGSVSSVAARALIGTVTALRVVATGQSATLKVAGAFVY